MSHGQDTTGAARCDSSGSTSLSLIESVKHHDPEAWTRLVRLYGPLVYRWCRHVGLRPDDAADVVQEVFAGVMVQIKTFRHDVPGATFRGWLYRITGNKICDHYRRRKGKPDAKGGTEAYQQVLDVVQPPEPSSQIDPGDDEGILTHGLLEIVRAEFEPRTWQAFWRVTVNEEPPANVAEDLGMTVQAIYKAKSRVLRRLRQRSEELLG